MTEPEFTAKWVAKAEEFERLGVSASGASLVRSLLEDLENMRASGDDSVLSLAQAANWSGYSPAQLARLVKQGKLPTLRPPGSRGRLTFRRRELPRKPGKTHTSPAGVHDLASRLSGGKKEGHHGHL